jgi:hypothetical protein
MIESPDREKISEILSDIDQADADGSQYVQRKLRNWNTRYCVWPGQSEDGRKHARRPRAARTLAMARRRQIRVCGLRTISFGTTVRS